MSKTYCAVYKCRLCGQIIDSGTRAGRPVAMKETSLMIHGIPSKNDGCISMVIWHICDNAEIGICDFIGWKEEQKNGKEISATHD